MLRAPDRTPAELVTPNMLLGAAPGIPFASATESLAPGDELYIYSDGATEVSGSDGHMIPFESFVENLRRAPPDEALDRGVYFVAQHASTSTLANDFSMVRLVVR